MNREALRAALGTLVADWLPKNAQRIECTYFDNQPPLNTFAMRVDPQPVTGRVVALTDEAIIVKTGRIAFAAVDRALATQHPPLGSRVRVTPYFRRDFAGERLDAPRQEYWKDLDGRTHAMTVMAIGGRIVRIPLPVKPTCPYLTDLVEQLEILPTPDGWRTIANLLVDAGAADVETVDPDEEHLIATPPEISFAVATAKFTGRLAVLCDTSSQNYAVELRANGATAARVEDITVTALATVLSDFIDDGQWRRIHIEVLKRG